MYKILLTCVGGVLAPQQIKLIKDSKVVPVHITGVDVNPDAIGKKFCDDFFVVPMGNDDSYTIKILEIIKKNKIDLLIPTSDEEAVALSRVKNKLNNICSIATIDYSTIKVLNNKFMTYNFLKKKGIHTPEFHEATSKYELIKLLKRMLKKKSRCVIKPSISRGGRNVFFVHDGNMEREDSISLETFIQTYLESLEGYYPFLLMEELTGPVVDIDLLAWKGKPLKVIPRCRLESENPNAGHHFLDDKKLIKLGNDIIRIFNLSWLYDCDVMFDSLGNPCILELNPRQSGSVSVSAVAGIGLYDDLIHLARNELSKVQIENFKVPEGVKVIAYKALEVIEK